jgi:hypothetical protein
MTKPFATAFLLALCGAAGAAPQVSGDGACGIRAVDNESFLTCEDGRAPVPVDADDTGDLPAPMPISARQARQMKHDLGRRILLVDIRARTEFRHPGRPPVADARAPFMEPAPGRLFSASGGRGGMDFNPRFLERMDWLLANAGLRHGDPVVLMGESGDRGRLAAELMNEHGYLQVFVVPDRLPEHLRADGLAATR